MNRKHISLVILNTITLAVMLFANYACNAGVFSNASVADISHQYDTLFAPAAYAFIIWIVLFILCICFVIYQWILLKKNDPRHYIKRTGIWFAISNIANALWLYCWTNEMIGLSVVLILLLLSGLIILTIRLRAELDDEPVLTIFFVWWPITYYLGWIMVATIACIASWLVYTAWRMAGLTEDVWTIIMIAIACLLYLFLIKKRNMREAATIGIWAFIAIAVRQWYYHKNITMAAIMSAVILMITLSIHAYRNRHYNIGSKIKKGEW